VPWKFLGSSCLLMGIGAYQYENNHSFRSVCNLGYAGVRMAYIYKYTNLTIHQKNTTASEYLRDSLKNNGGIYLKLGQLIATLDVIVPD
jgi:predicted unusual protein kinase regulating ubiquinone biosynthesis (AarF/ABC1/UbiB family)